MTREQQLEIALRLLLDQIDYRHGACSLTDMVGALIPKEVLTKCDEALQRTE